MPGEEEKSGKSSPAAAVAPETSSVRRGAGSVAVRRRFAGAEPPTIAVRPARHVVVPQTPTPGSAAPMPITGRLKEGSLRVTALETRKPREYAVATPTGDEVANRAKRKADRKDALCASPGRPRRRSARQSKRARRESEDASASGAPQADEVARRRGSADGAAPAATVAEGAPGADDGEADEDEEDGEEDEETSSSSEEVEVIIHRTTVATSADVSDGMTSAVGHASFSPALTPASSPSADSPANAAGSPLATAAGTRTSSPSTSPDASPGSSPDGPGLLPPRTRQLARRPPVLGPPADPNCLTVVLDMDETLLHSSFVNLERTPASRIRSHDFGFLVDDDSLPLWYREVRVWKRPGLDPFLQYLATFAEIVVFTASQATYANPLIDIIDPSGFISGRLFRQHTYPSARGYLKDLAVLGRPLSRTVLVDNSPVSFHLQPDNGIPIVSYYGDPFDNALEQLAKSLFNLSKLPDVQPFLRNHFRLHEVLAPRSNDLAAARAHNAKLARSSSSPALLRKARASLSPPRKQSDVAPRAEADDAAEDKAAAPAPGTPNKTAPNKPAPNKPASGETSTAASR